jgi:hypothetical protein
MVCARVVGWEGQILDVRPRGSPVYVTSATVVSVTGSDMSPGPSLVSPSTTTLPPAAVASLATTDSPPRHSSVITAGLEAVLQSLREVVAFPLQYPHVFEHLGIAAPKGVLLYGPAGCGKTTAVHASTMPFCVGNLLPVSVIVGFFFLLHLECTWCFCCSKLFVVG